MGSYCISRLALVALAVTALGACARDVTSPSGAKTAPRLAAAVARVPNQIVLFKGNSIPDNFAARAAALGGTVTSAWSDIGIAVVSGLSDEAAAALASGKDVSDVLPDLDLVLTDQRLPGAQGMPMRVQSSTRPDLAFFYQLGFEWNMSAIHAEQAWSAGKLGSSDVTVAILDTGIDYASLDLAGLVDLSRSVSFDTADDRLVSTYFQSWQPVADLNGHGTNVATQVSSKALAVAGVTSRTRLMAVKVLGASGSGEFSSILGGIRYAANYGADVANLSLGMPEGGPPKTGLGRYTAMLNRAFNFAKQKGMLVVVSAGNDALDLDHDGNGFGAYCTMSHVICVSATGPVVAGGNLDVFAVYSDFGRSAVAVAAPGGNLGSTPSSWPWGVGTASGVWSLCSQTALAGFLGDGTPVVDPDCATGLQGVGYLGTSQAAPHVSGLAALLVAEIGHDKPAQIKAAIQKSADDLGQPGTDPYYGAGRINVAKALGL